MDRRAPALPRARRAAQVKMDRDGPNSALASPHLVARCGVGVLRRPQRAPPPPSAPTADDEAPQPARPAVPGGCTLLHPQLQPAPRCAQKKQDTRDAGPACLLPSIHLHLRPHAPSLPPPHAPSLPPRTPAPPVGVLFDNRARPHQYMKPGEAGVGAGMAH
jgi:hypothetical protein